MPVGSVTVASITPPKRRNHRRARVRVDRRYALGRRVGKIAQHFRERLGSDADDPITSAAIQRAAELAALAESARARALRADPSVSMDDVVRLSRAADLAVRRLQLDRHKAAGQSLAEYLASRDNA